MTCFALWLLRVALGHLALVCRERSQDFPFLLVGHFEGVERSSELGRHLVELGGRDLQLAMGFFQAERCAAWFRGCVVLGSAGDVADPEGAHELEAWKSAQVVGVPFPEGGVLRALADDRVVHDRVAEVVDYCCDGECATEAFVETRFRHLFLLGSSLWEGSRAARYYAAGCGSDSISASWIGAVSAMFPRKDDGAHRSP